MTWMGVYLFCIAFGGVLLGTSFLLGGHGDVDADGDADLDHGDADHESGPAQAPGFGASVSFLPFLSLRFWTFMVESFGLCGALLSMMGLPSGLTISISLAVGTGIGWASFQFFRWLLREEVSGAVGLRDYVDQEARVLLPVRVGGQGKVVVSSLAGRVELVAFTRDGEDIPVGRPVLIVAVDREGRAEVTTLKTTESVADRAAQDAARTRARAAHETER